MKQILTFCSVLLLFSNISRAQYQHYDGYSDDRDLSFYIPYYDWSELSYKVEPDQIEFYDTQKPFEVSVFHQYGEQYYPVAGLEFQVLKQGCNQDGTLTVRATLENQYFSIKQSNPYYIELEVPCNKHAVLKFHQSSVGGQAVGLWETVFNSVWKLNQHVGLDFWREKLDIKWPEQGDYYSWGTVHISRGDHWDVVAHELGHAIYDMANLGRFGGGAHKIDECYSNALAISEGWASYFSAWTRVPLDAENPKFEFMVPRRPIFIENVPADVCKDPSNEWRVMSFLWDLVDTHEDNENLVSGFAHVWLAMLNQRHPSIRSVYEKLLENGFTKDQLDSVWSQNFK